MVLLKENSVCVFIHFSEKKWIPYYVRLYVNELSLYFSKIIFSVNANDKIINRANYRSNVEIIEQENIGYDAGRFITVVKSLDIQFYSRIAFVNDSNYLIGSLYGIFQWGNQSGYDLWGIMDSYQKPSYSINKVNYHIQSHFLVFEKETFPFLVNYINIIDINKCSLEMSQHELRTYIINYWEIGLSQFLVGKDMKIGSFISSKSFTKRYLDCKKDMYLAMESPALLIKNGYPFLKKKVLKNYYVSFLALISLFYIVISKHSLKSKRSLDVFLMRIELIRNFAWYFMKVIVFKIALCFKR